VVLDNIRAVARKLANCSDIDGTRMDIGRSAASDR
jgi:hypothetical protein